MYESVATRIKVERARKGISQTSLAREANVGQLTISRAELGRYVAPGALEIWPETPILPKPSFSYRRLSMK